MSKNLAVVLTSGGLDSAVAAAVTAQDTRVALLHLQYGQRAAEQELKAFQDLCMHLKPSYSLIASLGQWAEVCESSQVCDSADIEDAAAIGPYLATSFTPMLVPAMLCIASAWAYRLEALRVVWGGSVENAGNYPDRGDPVRLLAWQLAKSSLPPDRAPAIESPLAQYDKAAVAKLAAELNVPTLLTWSCLRGGEKHCQRCIGCAARKKALGDVPAGA